jgi:hypothetical protein
MRIVLSANQAMLFVIIHGAFKLHISQETLPVQCAFIIQLVHRGVKASTIPDFGG